ncbi:unnamed protein product [Closterium sp. NIES-54]
MADTKLKLKSSDNEIFEVDQEVALQSDTVKNMIEDVDVSSASEPIPLPNVSGRILAKVIEYCKYHVDAKKPGSMEKPAVTDDEVKAWDQEFVKVDQATLFDLILAANYLHIKDLLELTTISLQKKRKKFVARTNGRLNDLLDFSRAGKDIFWHTCAY